MARGQRSVYDGPLSVVWQEVLAIITSEGISRVSYRTGLCESTLRKWKQGETTNPQTASVNMVLKQYNVKISVGR